MGFLETIDARGSNYLRGLGDFTNGGASKGAPGDSGGTVTVGGDCFGSNRRPPEPPGEPRRLTSPNLALTVWRLARTLPPASGARVLGVEPR